MSLKTFYHPGFAAPIGEQHVMPMRKFALVAEQLRQHFPRVELIEPAPVNEANVLRVHTRAYVEAIKTGQPRELAETQKFPWSPALFPSVLLTNGGVLSAGRAALQEGLAAALCSGFHHACADHGEGFCTFNGLIVTADALLAEGRAKHVAILDMDLHYGNGTAQLAIGRSHVTALSLYGNDYWQNVPYRDVRVRRHGDGENHRSAALPEACDRPKMLHIMENELPWLLSRGKPDLLLYQAGADPYFEDPYSPLHLDHDDLLERDRYVFRFARDNGIPVAWVLAGGYTKDTSKVVKVHTNTFVAAMEVFGGSDQL
jgi:acetoin utilization deacetylase AcuC-like enzyme